MTESRPEQPPGLGPNEPLRLSAAGSAASAWIAVLTTEHYNMQTQRAATIGEANGRASIFLGALSAGLIALGFYGHAGHSAGTTTFYTLVLSSLAYLGVVTFIRCLEISIDDWQFNIRIARLRAIYAELVPELADLLLAVAGAEQAVAMLTPRRQPFQRMLSVAGSIGVITSVVIGADVGVLAYGLHAPLATALPAGVTVGLVSLFASVRFQSARWKGASVTDPAPGSI
ncbi:hypothetical protein ABZS88_46700 [Streptomyces sp. NPDC005480]|uniref:hypothetical protein n=1 Tax=Streptomyces sp. NPDC005480 TaxID=3154880 RepID=UPI0033A7FC6C